ncbi:MAG: alanine racemase [Anaerolineales bacterium]|nr:alanine racemase [Anaerolineales bacterium]
MSINFPTIATKGIVRPTHLEINLDRLVENFNAIRAKTAPARIMPILKANAYGHGLVEVAKLMQTLGADYLGVAVVEEGILLRENGITIPILVLGSYLGTQLSHFIEHDLTITTSSVEKIWYIDEVAEQLGAKAKIHLKIDTGMERIGIHYYSAESLLEAAIKCQHVEVEGIFSHFANSEAADLSYSRLQLERFQEVLSFYEKHSLRPPAMRHMANSGAILQLPEATFDLVRPGLLLYGIYPDPATYRSIPVKPALSWKSRVVYFKVIKPGHPVGYGSTWESDHNIRAVTVPLGYGDGYFRSMSGKAWVLIRGKKYPVVGQISMDQLVVNIEWDSAYNDDEVVLIGEMGQENITAEDLAAWAGTIPYEILTNINTRVSRVYTGGNTGGQ